MVPPSHDAAAISAGSGGDGADASDVDDSALAGTPAYTGACAFPGRLRVDVGAGMLAVVP